MYNNKTKAYLILKAILNNMIIVISIKITKCRSNQNWSKWRKLQLMKEKL